jgi:ribonucleases P/MRP protein subunit RPP40
LRQAAGRNKINAVNYISGWLTIPSGVPQGSLLGPLLFAVFVNDIESCLQVSRLLCFADDMKVLASITSLADAVSLQSDLARLDKYCADNLLDLNPSKCSIVTYSRKRELVLFDYKLKGTRLKRDSVGRDLGVYHDSKLLFNVHIDNVISKASRALGFVMPSSVDFHHIKTLKILYCSFVRSHFEYASQI